MVVCAGYGELKQFHGHKMRAYLLQLMDSNVGSDFCMVNTISAVKFRNYFGTHFI
jgi:hypothetical protein